MMHGVLWCVALGCGVVWSAHAMVVGWGAVRGVVRCGAVWCGVVCRGAVRCCLWRGVRTARCGAVRLGVL